MILHRHRLASLAWRVADAMPELPDLAIYLEGLEARIRGSVLERIRIANPFLLRSVTPPLEQVAGLEVVGLRRIGKRIVIELHGHHFLILHLMIAGRLHWRDRVGAPLGKRVLAVFDFTSGTVLLTEQGATRRAALHIVQGEDELREHDPGGLEPLGSTLADFRAALTRERHTLKRALTDPRLIAGIGNAYSDEILHAAKLSPLRLTSQLTGAEIASLHRRTQQVLRAWIARLRSATGSGFPEGVTAFRPGMAVHGRYRQPCPTCGSPVQRIAYATREANYCATCQTGGRLLADRALSRLLKADWPRTLEEWEERVTRR